MTHEIIAHFFWGRSTSSHITEWKDNPRKEGPPSIRVVSIKKDPIKGAPAKYYLPDGQFDQSMRKVLPEDKIQLTKDAWKGQNYIKDGAPTNTFFKQDGVPTSIIDLKKEVNK